MHRRSILVGIGLGAIAPMARAETATAEDPSTFYKVLPRTFSISGVPILPPPSDNLLEARLLIGMKGLRTPERIKAIVDQSVNPMPLFWDCAGASPEAHPVFANRLNEAVSDVELVVLALKKKFNRARPSAVLAAIDPVVPVPWHASYPSGHATQSTVIAELLSRVIPGAATRLRALAIQVAENREVAGLHYPSDTAAGIALGILLSNKSFFLDDSRLRSR